MLKSGPQPYADCPHCEWDKYCVSEKEATILEVLHRLEKHPEEYRKLTGKDPELAKHEHWEMLRIYKRML